MRWLVDSNDDQHHPPHKRSNGGCDEACGVAGDAAEELLATVPAHVAGTKTQEEQAMSEQLVVVVSKSQSEFEKFMKLHQIAVIVGGPIGDALLKMLATQYDGVMERVELDDADR